MHYPTFSVFYCTSFKLLSSSWIDFGDLNNFPSLLDSMKMKLGGIALFESLIYSPELYSKALNLFSKRSISDDLAPLNALYLVDADAYIITLACLINRIAELLN